MTQARSLVLYHKNCYDGFTAAWAAWRALGDAAEYRPVAYGDPVPEDVDGRAVSILDFSWPRVPMLEIIRRAQHVVILDHHKTAQADLADLPGQTIVVRFDLTMSGATLAWNHWHGVDGVPPPLIVRYAEDRDLWRFALSGSREVSAWMRSFPWTFEAWNEMHERLIASEDSCILEGHAILRFQSQIVANMADNAWWFDCRGHRVPVTNATAFFSEVGEELCRRHLEAPFAAYYLDRADGQRQWGLRSRSGFDCSEIAKAMGGGGHPGAAGWVEARP